MANYQNIVDVCRDSVPNDLRFIHGLLVDFSQDFQGTYPLVTLSPFIITDARGTQNAIFDSANLAVGFWEEDTADSTPEEREAIIARMDNLSNEFLDNILESEVIKLTNIEKEPVYFFYQATLTGLIVRFTISLAPPC